MSLNKEKFDLFVKTSEDLPNIFSLKIHSKIEQFLDGVMPELTSDERKNIENYLPNQVWSNFNRLKDDVIDEINWNVAKTPSESQQQSYLEYLDRILFPITTSLKRATWFEEVDKVDQKFIIEFPDRLEQNQIDSFILLHELLWKSNRYYFVMYDNVEKHVVGLLISKCGVVPTRYKKKPLTAYLEPLKKFDNKHPSDDIITLNDLPGYEPKTFKSLFKDWNIYESLIEFMISEKLLSRMKDNLIWKGFRSNAKYEIAAFVEALYEADLIKRKTYNDVELTTLAASTFYGFSATDRVMRKKTDSFNEAIKKYRELLAYFNTLNQTFP